MTIREALKEIGERVRRVVEIEKRGELERLPDGLIIILNRKVIASFSESHDQLIIKNGNGETRSYGSKSLPITTKDTVDAASFILDAAPGADAS